MKPAGAALFALVCCITIPQAALALEGHSQHCDFHHADRQWQFVNLDTADETIFLAGIEMKNLGGLTASAWELVFNRPNQTHHGPSISEADCSAYLVRIFDLNFRNDGKKELLRNSFGNKACPKSPGIVGVILSRIPSKFCTPDTIRNATFKRVAGMPPILVSLILKSYPERNPALLKVSVGLQFQLDPWSIGVDCRICGSFGSIGRSASGIYRFFSGNKQGDGGDYQEAVKQHQEPLGRAIYEGVIPLAFVFTFFCVALCALISARCTIFAVALFGYGWLLLIVGIGIIR